MISNDHFDQAKSAKLEMVIAFKSIESKLEHLYVHVTQELKNISSCLEMWRNMLIIMLALSKR